jgi:competence protein ComEC
MPIQTNGNMWLYCLNVGQADTTLIVTPAGKTILIDAVRPGKIEDLLNKLGVPSGGIIDHMIITHPHSDHYSGAVGVLNAFDVQRVTLSSIWQLTESMPGYHSVINTLADKSIPVTFLAGHMQFYPDGSPIRNPDAPQIELLGPSHGIIDSLQRIKQLSHNHRSIITRLQLGSFAMVIAADAQMENWAYFDGERMLERNCNVLRAAHHGSANGTQYERLDRLSPRDVIVSSDPDSKHHLPDLIGVTIFRRYASNSSKPTVALTSMTGTIKIDVKPSGRYDMYFYGEDSATDVPIGQEQPLDTATNPTDWEFLLHDRIAGDH